MIVTLGHRQVLSTRHSAAKGRRVTCARSCPESREGSQWHGRKMQLSRTQLFWGCRWMRHRDASFVHLANVCWSRSGTRTQKMQSTSASKKCTWTVAPRRWCRASWPCSWCWLPWPCKMRTTIAVGVRALAEKQTGGSLASTERPGMDGLCSVKTSALELIFARLATEWTQNARVPSTTMLFKPTGARKRSASGCGPASTTSLSIQLPRPC